MFTTENAKELIEYRVKTNGTNRTRWCKEHEDDGWFGCVQIIGVLPAPCGQHSRDVYDGCINCNIITYAHFKKDKCLMLDDKYVAKSVYICLGASPYSVHQEANNHVGEIYVCFERARSWGEDKIWLDEEGFDLTLDELEQRNPELLKTLVFNLK